MSSTRCTDPPCVDCPGGEDDCDHCQVCKFCPTYVPDFPPGNCAAEPDSSCWATCEFACRELKTTDWGGIAGANWKDDGRQTALVGDWWYTKSLALKLNDYKNHVKYWYYL